MSFVARGRFDPTLPGVGGILVDTAEMQNAFSSNSPEFITLPMSVEIEAYEGETIKIVYRGHAASDKEGCKATFRLQLDGTELDHSRTIIYMGESNLYRINTGVAVATLREGPHMIELQVSVEGHISIAKGAVLQVLRFRGGLGV